MPVVGRRVYLFGAAAVLAKNLMTMHYAIIIIINQR